MKSQPLQPDKPLRTFSSTWRIASNKPTEFGFSYRWYIPRFIYGFAMHDLKYIKRNDKLIYKKAGYKPKEQPQ